jgi:uncharacterized membrane protein YfhO
MYHQYCPFFTEFLDKLQSGGSLMFTWREGLGSDFAALYAYYLASPLNWLLLLWPRDYVIEFMTLTILIKIGLAGQSMFVFLDAKREGNKKNTGGVPLDRAVALVFACGYALSGFVAAYSWDIMWMDGVALAPLVLLGLNRLVKKNRPALYYISLAVAIWANYYIGMILCIFLVFYFVLLFFEQKEGRGKAFLNFAWFSLLAGGTSAALLIPEAIVLGSSGSAGFSFPESISWYFGIIPELSRSCAMASVYTGTAHWPNLYAGTFTLPLVILYALNGKISWKKKLPRLLMVAFFLLSFSNNYLDFFWHGLHFPDSLPGRQSFLYAFLVLSIGYEALMEWKGVGIVRILLAYIPVFAMLVCGAFLTDEAVTDTFAFLMTGLFAACYLILMLLSKLAEKKWRRRVCLIACVLALSELAANIAVTGFYTTSRSNYLAKMDDYRTLLEQVQEIEESGNSEAVFYRVEDPQRLTKNDSALYGYSSATEFSSLMNINTSRLYQKLYMEGGKNYYCYNGSTPLTSAMLSVKYVLLDTDREDGALRKLVAGSGGQYLYENRYCLPIGYMVPEAAAEALDDLGASRIDALNGLATSLGASEKLLTSVGCAQEISEGSTEISIAMDGIYYAAYENCSADTLKASSSNGWKRKYGKTTHRYLLELTECQAGDTITITNTKSEEISFRLYRMSTEALDTAYSTLSANTLELTDFSDTSIAGTIDVAEEGRLVLSIPDLSGWTLYVDGSSTKIESFMGALASVTLPEGTHSIRLTYRTPGLPIGAVVSVACVLLFLLTMFIRSQLPPSCRQGEV